MALNNAIVRNKTIIQEIISADPQFILDKVIEKGLITRDGNWWEFHDTDSAYRSDSLSILLSILIERENRYKCVCLYLITDREYTKLNSISKGDAEDLVIKLVDILINKGRQSKFIWLLHDEIVLETYPKLKDVEWGDSGSTASSSSLSIGKSFRPIIC